MEITLPKLHLTSKNPSRALVDFIEHIKDIKYANAYVQPVIALAGLYPFDPNATLSNGEQLLHTIISMSNIDWIQGEKKGRRLPLTQDDPGEIGVNVHKKDTPSNIDMEWLAGLLVMAGADPWRMRCNETYGNKNALDLAIEHRLAALTEQLLQMPGAPKAADIARKSAVNGGNESNWNRLCSTEGSVDILETLVRWGADPHHEAPGHPLELATPKAVNLYAEKAWMPTDPEVCQRIQASWERRNKAGKLSLTQLSSMVQALSGNIKQGFTVAERGRIKALVSIPCGWVYPPSYMLMTPYNTPTQLTQASLNQRSVLTTGPHRGEWSGLTAAAYAFLRSTSTQKHPSQQPIKWNGKESFIAEIGEQGNKHLPEWIKEKGSLKKAVDFEWREGISAESIVMMTVLQQEDPGPLLDLLDIDNTIQWALKNLESAVAFTEAIVSSGRNPTQNRGMAIIWQNVAKQTGGPDQWGSQGWTLAQRINEALSGKSKTPWAAKEWASYVLDNNPLLKETATDEDRVAYGALLLTRALTPMDSDGKTIHVDALVTFIQALSKSAAKTWQIQAKQHLKTFKENNAYGGSHDPSKNLLIHSRLEALMIECVMDETPGTSLRRRM